MKTKLPLFAFLLLLAAGVQAQTSKAPDPASWQRYTVKVLRALPGGFTEKAIDAAKKIKFIPAMKDGRFVSMWMQLEYNFNLY